MVFSRREIRALALFVPLVGVLVWMLVEAFVPTEQPAVATSVVSADSVATSSVSPRNVLNITDFDPNTVSYEELRQMGVDKYVARNIVKYREGGRTYAIPEDVAVVYGVDDSLYSLLKPHIAIAKEFRLVAKKYDRKSDSVQSTFRATERKFRKVFFDPNKLDAEGFYELGCFTARQAEALVEYRERMGGFGSLLQFRDCYLIGDKLFAEMSEYITLSPVEDPAKMLVDINSADSLTLVNIRGIGPATARDIILYRQRLGGYHSKEQLFDLAVVQPNNYELFEKEIWCDSCKIRKIDINFVAPKELAEHPYMTPPRVRKIIKRRQLKGGWSTAEEFKADDILTKDEAERIVPYLSFTNEARGDN